MLTTYTPTARIKNEAWRTSTKIGWEKSHRASRPWSTHVALHWNMQTFTPKWEWLLSTLPELCQCSHFILIHFIHANWYSGPHFIEMVTRPRSYRECALQPKLRHWLWGGGAHQACRILALRPGIEPCPLQWKHGILTSRPPGKSLGHWSLILPPVFLSGKFQVGTLKRIPKRHVRS